MPYMKILPIYISVTIFVGITGFESIAQKQGEIDPKQVGHGYDFEGNGKDLKSQEQDILYQLSDSTNKLEEALVSDMDEIIRLLGIQKKYLESKDSRHTYDRISFDDKKLRETINTLHRIILGEEDISSLDLYRVAGEDYHGNVHFTAYYTPVLEARWQADSVFKYPIYRKPDTWNGSRPTRMMIDHEYVLFNRNLELAWTSNLLDNYFLQVQGSGFLQFEDSSTFLLLFEGQNGYAYTSIGKYMVNQGYIAADEISLPAIRNWFYHNPDSIHPILNRNESYTFFKLTEGKIKGAANTELVPGHSIAVDPKFITYGAVFLAKIPILNDQGNLVKHEYRLVSAQDRGGAIKGPGHIDLYEGVGETAELRAGRLHHYGKLWLILSK